MDGDTSFAAYLTAGFILKNNQTHNHNNININDN
jgi:hypothetical protein